MSELQPAYAGDAAAIEVEGEDRETFLSSLTGQTPWWIVSVLLHALVITLAGLLSIVMPNLDEDVEMTQTVTIYEQPKQVALTEEPKPNKSDVFNANETHPDAPAPTKDMVYSIELMQNAEWGDHRETINLDLPDTHEAHGVEDSKVMYSFTGVVDKSGGGGNMGLAYEDVTIGASSFGSKGTGGGMFGGDGSGKGQGKGEGTGTWGTRGGGRKLMLVKQGGGSRASEDAVHKALLWLAYHQEPDGHWDVKKYEGAVKTDTAATGLALLAFLGAGNSEKVGEFKGNVMKAVAWLKSKQAADGCIWDTSDDQAGHRRIGYPSAIATLAMAEAAGMANIADTKAAAQKAIDYCTEVHQFGDGYDKLGWRYAPKSEGDLSVSGWFIMALKSAKVAGLKVSPAAFDGAIKFLDSVEVKDGDVGGYPASHYKYMASNEHAHTGHRLTAIGTLARQFMGWKKDDLQGSVDWFVNKGGVPNAGANGESVDLYYWYYGSMCVFQQGGSVWDKWNAGMLKSLLGTQCGQGDAAGSWNPTGEYSTEWGRVGQTALSTLCLEVYYRYELLKSVK